MLIYHFLGVGTMTIRKVMGVEVHGFPSYQDQAYYYNLEDEVLSGVSLAAPALPASPVAAADYTLETPLDEDVDLDASGMMDLVTISAAAELV